MIINNKISLLLVAILSVSIFAGCINQGDLVDTEKVTLKIGTTNMVQASNYFDTSLSIFMKVTNLTLTSMDENGLIVGNMATNYEASNDSKTWKFYIDPNLYWSDGTKVTPEDVKFSIEYYAEKIPYAGWIKPRLDSIVVIPEENAVVINWNESYTRTDLEFATYNVLPKHIWESIEDPMNYIQTENYVGNGPYFVSNVNLESQVVTLNKNPYWKGPQSIVDTIEVHMYRSEDALALDLERGNLDVYYRYAGSYPYQNVQRLLDKGQYDILQRMNVGLVFLGLNLREAPSSDINFRNAISYAINYEEIVKIEALGYGAVPNRGFVPPTMGFFKETPQLFYDVEKSKRLLDEAGYLDQSGNGIRQMPDGSNMKINLLVRSDWIRSAELVQEYLKNVGIDVELKSVDTSTWISLKDRYDYDLTITRTTPWGMLMHAQWGTGYFDSRRTGQGVLHILDDPEFLKICDNILATSDPVKLEQYAHDVQDYYSENLPGITLYWNEVITPYSNKYTGWYVDPLYGIYNKETFFNLKKVS